MSHFVKTRPCVCVWFITHKSENQETISWYYTTEGISMFNSQKPYCWDIQAVCFAPFCLDTWLYCILCKLWPHGKMVECWSDGARMCCVGYRVPTLFMGVQLKSYFKHNLTTCGSVCTCTPLHVELFICLLQFLSPCDVRQYKSSSKTMTAFKGRTWWREEK